ncbi:MAG: hypothetical protein LBG10_03840, partial [Treponema sp.]|nr:hypothetical protein [Treponema sp.]
MLNPNVFPIGPFLLLCNAALLMGFGAQEVDQNSGPGTPPLYRDRNKTAQVKPESKKNQADGKVPEKSGPGTPPLYRDRNKTAQVKPESKKPQADGKAPE